MLRTSSSYMNIKSKSGMKIKEICFIFQLQELQVLIQQKETIVEILQYLCDLNPVITFDFIYDYC